MSLWHTPQNFMSTMQSYSPIARRVDSKGLKLQSGPEHAMQTVGVPSP
jgi:hypothetical protein